MKIAKKISLIFIGSTLIIVLICVLFGAWMLNELNVGEQDRAIGRSTSIYNLYNREIEELKAVTVEIKEAFSVRHYIIEEKRNKFEKEVHNNLEKMFKSNDIFYVGIIKDKKYIEEVMNKGLDTDLKNKILNQSDRKDSVVGTLVFKDKVYIVDMENISQFSDESLGKVIVIREVNDKFINLMRHISDKKAGIDIKFKPNGNPTEYIGREKVPIYNVTEKEYITSYIGINTIVNGEKVYLTLTEDRLIVDRNNSVVGRLIGLLLIIIIGINLITYLIVRNKLIKRIMNMKKEVNGIIESEEIKAHLNSDNENDEITSLTIDINKMIDNLREVNFDLDSSKLQYRNLLKTMSNGLLYLKVEGYGKYKIVEINDSAKKMLKLNIEYGYENEYLQGNTEVRNIIRHIDNSIKSKKLELDAEILLRDGLWVDISFQLKEDGIILIVLNDVTDLKRYSEEMKYLANYDTLTGVLNRYNIMGYIKHLTKRDEDYIVYFIDLDNFKGLNDTLGHNMGDEVLCAVSEALNIICTDDIKVGRLGGDEFVVVKKGNNDEEEAEDLAVVILEILNSVISLNRLTFELSGSIGISFYPYHSTEMNEVIQYADIAMYNAKAMGGNNFKIFSSEMLEGLEIENRLKEAILKDEFTMYYQPIYDIKKQSITGCEALIRWIREGEIIPPDKFIPIAKKNGDIIEIDKLVFDKSIKYCKEMVEEFGEFTMSVNLSYKFLKQYNFVDEVKEILIRHKLDPRHLRVEVTEDEFIEDVVETSRILNELREIGIGVSLDDFGTGYSSFNYLKQLPVDIIKIDRSIVSRVCEDQKAFNILETLINLCHELNFRVVCEGVEYRDELEVLRELGCDKIQGYYISRPVCEKEFREIIEKNH